MGFIIKKSDLPKDICPLLGLWMIFEFPKCEEEVQKYMLDMIKMGDYARR